MKAKNYLSAILILLSCYGYKVEAQSKLGFGAFTLNKDSLYVGNTLVISTTLYNYNDTAAYNDLLSVGLKINGIENVNQVMFPNPFYDVMVNLPPGDSETVEMTINITSAYFDIGPDILVVWPIARDLSPPFATIDTTIYVLNQPVDTVDTGSNVGIKPVYDNRRLKAYYLNDNVYLKADDAGITFNRVSIFDLTGKEIISLNTDGSKPVAFNPEADGIYFVKVYFNKGETAIYKIVK
jgi:hypothetical protein